jgi:acyl-CoA thioesterase YciA
MDKCVFKRPAKEGNLIKIYALVSKMGDTSVTFEVEARTYNVFRGDEQIILNTHMTFVRVDNEGVPISISETVKKRFSTSRIKTLIFITHETNYYLFLRSRMWCL